MNPKPYNARLDLCINVVKVHDLKGKFFLQSMEVIERNCGESSFWILGNGGIIDQRR
jgi:hypothetical protein